MTIEELHHKLSLLALTAIGDEPLITPKPRIRKPKLKRSTQPKPDCLENKNYIQFSLFD